MTLSLCPVCAKGNGWGALRYSLIKPPSTWQRSIGRYGLGLVVAGETPTRNGVRRNASSRVLLLGERHLRKAWPSTFGTTTAIGYIRLVRAETSAEQGRPRRYHDHYPRRAQPHRGCPHYRIPPSRLTSGKSEVSGHERVSAQRRPVRGQLETVF